MAIMMQGSRTWQPWHISASKAPFHLQITGSVCERRLLATWAMLLWPTWSAAAVCKPILFFFVTERDLIHDTPKSFMVLNRGWGWKWGWKTMHLYPWDTQGVLLSFLQSCLSTTCQTGNHILYLWDTRLGCHQPNMVFNWYMYRFNQNKPSGA